MPAAGADPVAPPAKPQPGVAQAPGTPALASPPAEDATARVGQATGAGNRGGLDGRGRAGVTLEQGDGWSLEVWPARADAGMAAGRAAQDALTDTRAKSGAAMAERSATDRRGTRSGA